MSKFVAIAAIVTMANAGRAAADEETPAPPTRPAAIARTWRGAMPVVGAGYSIPLRSALSLGVIWGEHGGCLMASRGVLVQLEPGVSGGKASIGLAASMGGPVPSVGVAMKASLIRTWGSAYRAEGDTTYAGPEAVLNLFHVKANLGYAWPVSGRGRAGILVFGVGLGF